MGISTIYESRNNQSVNRSAAQEDDELDLSGHEVSRLRFNVDNRVKRIQSYLKASRPLFCDLDISHSLKYFLDHLN